jgi:putative transposase
VRYFNRRHERTGTLWEGRFRSCLVESAAFVLACYRYVESNPVRAGMVGHPEAYPWSSYAANSGVYSDPLVKPHCEFRALSSAQYRALFDQALEDSLLRTIREATNGGYPLASDAFKSGTLAPRGYRTGRARPGPRVEAQE